MSETRTPRDRRRRVREYVELRGAEDRKQSRAVRVRRCMDAGYLPRVGMQEGYEG